MTSRILVVDDDTALAEMIGIVLEAEGFEAVFCADGDAALDAFRTARPDLILLDLMLPGMDGIEICTQVRAESGIPIIMLTARTDTADVVRGLESGADDYIVKPYELRELLARVRSVLRRVPPPSTTVADQAQTPARRTISFGAFTADLDGRMVMGPGGMPLEMAKSEFDVLEVFLTRANRLLSRAALAEAIGFAEEIEESRALDIRVMRLRKKIEPDPANPRFLRTVRGEGYIFSLNEPSAHRTN